MIEYVYSYNGKNHLSHERLTCRLLRAFAVAVTVARQLARRSTLIRNII